MARILALAAGLLAAGCGPMPPVDLCKHAAVRRQAYSIAITAADRAIAGGRPVPAAVILSREAATTALLLLDRHCPIADQGDPRP